MANHADEMIVAIVVAQIRQGLTTVQVPKSLAAMATEEGAQAVRELAAVNELDVVFVDE
jgi:cytosine/adenosine deaminase-related metal-dependent hydrolase